MKAPLTLRLSPKARFLQDRAACSLHSDYMASPQFAAAAQVALLELQYSAVGSDLQSMAAAAIKLRGAQEFLDKLMNAGNPAVPQATPDSANLTPPEAALARFPEPPTET